MNNDYFMSTKITIKALDPVVNFGLILRDILGV
jgi:hypothetical protein